LAGLPSFASRLRAAEDWFERRGQRLIYFSAPVKTSWFPDRIPPDFPCPATKRDQVRPFVLAAFRKAGVDFVDGREALEAQRDRSGIELFPRNGIHWNMLGAAIGADALLERLHSLGLAVPTRLNYHVTVEGQETGQDRDLSDLLNLLWQPPADPSPALEVERPATRAGSLRLVAINDSFFGRLPSLFEAARVFGSETLFGYMTLDQERYHDGEMVILADDDAEIMRTVLGADVVVLEEVESRTGGPYALHFLDLVEARMT
jgi:hypothetical protein